MVGMGLLRYAPARGRHALREAAWLFLLVFASTVLWVTVSTGVGRARDVLLATFDPQLVGSVVYTTAGVATLCVGYAMVRYVRGTANGWDRLDLVQLGGVAALLSFTGTYWLHGATDVSPVPQGVITALLVGPIGMGALAVAYASERGFDLELAAPGRDAIGPAVAVGIGALAVGVGWIIVLVLTANPILGLTADRAVASRVSLGGLFWASAVPSVLVAIGWGVFYNGAIQEGLRRALGPARAVAATTVLVGVVALTSGLLLRVDGVAATMGAAAAIAVLSLVAALIGVESTEFLIRSTGTARTPVVGGTLGVLIIALALVGSAVVFEPSANLVLAYLGLTITVAIATVGYERARTVWVPALGFATYFIVADATLARLVVGLFS